jgi:hypothetical protein
MSAIPAIIKKKGRERYGTLQEPFPDVRPRPRHPLAPDFPTAQEP